MRTAAQRWELEVDPSASGRRDGRATTDRVVVLLGVVGCIALLALHVAFAVSMQSPFVFGDEAGYLGNAHELVHGSGATGQGFFAGYSVLLVPALLLSGKQQSFYDLALITNVLLSMAVVPLVFVFVRRVLPAAPPRAAMAAALLTALLPALLVGPTRVMSEAAMIPAVVATGCLVGAAADRRAPALWAAAGALAGFTTWINPRGVFVVPGFLLALAFVGRPVRRQARSWIVGLGAVLLVVGGGRLLHSMLPGGDEIKGARIGVVAPVLEDFGVETLVGATGRLLGSGLYVGAATAGIVFVGLAALVVLAWRVRDDPTPAAATATFATVSFALTWVALSARLPADGSFERYDLLVYGRYLENVIAPVLAVGLALFFVPDPGGRLRRVRDGAWLLVPPLVLVLAASTPALSLPLEASSRVNWGSVPSLRVYEGVLGTLSTIRWGVVAAALCLLVLAVLRRAPSTGALVVGALLLAGSAAAFVEFSGQSEQAYLLQSGVRSAVAQVETEGIDRSCISWDAEATTAHYLGQYRFLLPDSRFVAVHPPSERPACPLVVSTRRDLDRAYPDARHVAAESDRPVHLWVVAPDDPSAS